MTTFDEREQSFEKRFVHAEEVTFRATARRNKWLGLWAAERLGKSGDEAEAYAQGVVLADFSKPGEKDVLQTVHDDLEAAGIPESVADLRARMDALLDEAIEDVKAGR